MNKTGASAAAAGVRVEVNGDSREGSQVSQTSHASRGSDRGGKADEPAKEAPLLFVTVRQRNAVSRREDETDSWGMGEIDQKEECKLVLRDPRVSNMVLSRLNTFRRNRELCDIVLFVREREILAHKVVLAAISTAFLDMFVNENENDNSTKKPLTEATPPPAEKSKASRSNMSFFEFSQGDFECFDALVEFAYTGVLSISNRKVADLYKTAYALQVHAVANACARHLAENLSVANCVGIRKHANFNNDVFLVQSVDSFIAQHFAEVVDQLEFTQLPCIKARIIVSHAEKVEGHLGESLAQRALAYFQRQPKISDRVDLQIQALAQKSHLLFVEEDTTLQDCADMDDQSSVGSCDMVQDYKRAKQSKSSKTAGHNSQLIGTQTVQHHVTGALPVKINASKVANAKYASNESLQSCASSDTDVEDEIETKLIAVEESSRGFWIALAVLFKRLVAFSIQLTDDEEVAGSGDSATVTPPLQEPKNGSTNANSANTTKQTTDVSQTSVLARLANCVPLSRQPLPTMSVARCSVGAAFLNGKIIVCGGYDRGECLKTVEQFDVMAHEWRRLASMNSERGRFDAAVSNGKLYAVAGSNGNNDLKSAEVYDPKLGKWVPIAAMAKARSHNGCASLNGLIYSIGGANDQVTLRDAERYDPAEDKWEGIPPMQQARQQAACIAWRGLVVTVGGCDRWNCLDSVEAFDPATNQWRTLAKLTSPRRGCAVAVVRDSLYVIGGHDGHQSLNLVEVLDSANGHWRTAPSLNTPRANTHAVVTAGNAIYVIGGFDGNQFLSTMEVLENESIGWRNWIQKRLSQDVVLEEDDDETEDSPKNRADSVTPRASIPVS